MIIFQNPGLIDVAAITTMGVSVKDEGAIGYFGTGLKFAIATLLRHGCTITIYRSDEPLTFTAAEIEVRGAKFDCVYMNGQPLGFTTTLGRDWLPWMAFRELASNCRDEGGDYWRGESFPLESGQTTIVVDGEAIMDVWNERASIMLEGDPLLTTEHAEIREGSSPYVFYRGVRIFTAPRPMTNTYNILSTLELTEDRTAKNWYQVEIAIECCIGALEDRAQLRRILTCGELYAEHHMNVPAYGMPKEVFCEVSREIAMGSTTEANANPHAVSFARESAIRDMKPGDSVALDAVQSKMLERATSMLVASGFAIDEFPVIVCDTLGPNIHGMAHNGSIFLSLLAFAKGTREVAATLLEEFAHLKSGQSDCTRGFQNWLFDQLLVRSERAANEPF